MLSILSLLMLTIPGDYTAVNAGTKEEVSVTITRDTLKIGSDTYTIESSEGTQYKVRDSQGRPVSVTIASRKGVGYIRRDKELFIITHENNQPKTHKYDQVTERNQDHPLGFVR